MKTTPLLSALDLVIEFIIRVVLEIVTPTAKKLLDHTRIGNVRIADQQHQCIVVLSPVEVRLSPGTFEVRVLEVLKSGVFSEIRPFRAEMDELAKSVSFISEKLDEPTGIMKAVKLELESIKRENEDLRNKNTELSNEVNVLKDRVRSMEQYSRNNNIEISGIPVSQNENVCKIVQDVRAALDVEVKLDDIAVAHRVPSFKKDRITAIIVQFLRRSARDSLLSKFRERKGTPVTAQKVNSAFPQQNVYVNEHFSPENKLFLAKFKAKCRELGYEHAWYRDGNFLARKRQGDIQIFVL